MSEKYIRKDECARQDNHASKSDAQSDCGRKNEIEKYWISKDDVQRDYDKKSELKKIYVARDEVSRGWIPKETG